MKSEVLSRIEDRIDNELALTSYTKYRRTLRALRKACQELDRVRVECVPDIDAEAIEKKLTEIEDSIR